MKYFAGAVFLLAPLFCGAFPKNELSNSSMECYTCNSKDSPDCAQNPTASFSLKIESCKDPDDHCITAIIDRITHRGCEKEVNAPSDAISKSCINPRCNNEIFPKDRLKCYQCENGCAEIDPAELQPCVNYDQNDSCITDVIDETDVIRRCGSDSDYPLGQFAEICKESGCNNHSTTYTSECITCAEANSTSCVGKSRSVQSELQCTIPKDSTCKETLLLNRPIQCFTYIATNNVVRGCVKDAGELALDSDNFKPCEGELCNNKCLLTKCVKCNSKTNPKCANQANTIEPELCLGDNACYTAEKEEGVIQRGCGERLVKSKQINSCHEDGCNNKDLPVTLPVNTMCYKCNSQDLAECATNPTENLPPVRCNDAEDNCITAIVDGVTYRGCEKEVDVQSYAKSSKCSSSFCNSEIFPSDRFECYQCEGKDCVKNFENYLRPCADYTDKKCLTIVESEYNITRKCSLDPGYSSRRFAVTCEGNGCNDQPATYSAKCLSCIQTNDTSCVRLNSASASEDKCTLPPLTTCTDTPLLNRPSCFTYKKSGEVVRGCIQDAAKNLIKDVENFNTCEGPMCNNNCLPIKCISCNSDVDARCVNQPKHLELQQCNEALACFVGETEEGAIIRGCGAQSTEVKKIISACYVDGCNNGYYHLMKKMECYKCYSNKFAECGTNPSASLPHATCEDPKDSCFTYKISSKVVRGCTKEAGDLANDVNNFSTCEGRMCNAEDLPLKCISCDSKVDPRCTQQAKEIAPQKCTSETACFSGQTSEGSIIRGCGAKSAKVNNITSCYVNGCNSKEYPPTTSCQGKGCNSKKIECYQCDSVKRPECATFPSPILPHDQCEDPKDKCITAIVNGVTYRGCEKEVPAGYTLVDKCDSNLCNIEIFPKNRNKCYQCEGKDCVQNFEKYLRPCADFDNDSLCVTIVESRKNVIRKCLSPYDNSIPTYAEKCKGSGCNNHPATYEAQCLFCDESTDLNTYCVRNTSPLPSGEKCTIPVANFTTCTFAPLLNRPISCFTYTKSGRVTRGCTADVGSIKFDKKNFKECEGRMCNNECLSINCISCNSKTDVRCIKSTNWLEYQNCPNQMSCFYGQTKEGVVIRGCGDQSTELTEIKTCYSDGCNNKVLPPPNTSSCQGPNCNNGNDNGQQKHCYQCKDSTNCRKTPDRSLLKPCASPSDGCMQYVNIMHEMVRGCKYDNDYNECLKNGKECLQCTEDGCNNVGATKTAKLSCHMCDASDANCIYAINKDESTKCQPTAPFYVDSFGCYSCLSKDNKTANRGCYSGETYTSNDDSTCRTCTTDDCNDESLFVQSCIQCEGDKSSCNGGLPGTVCKKSVYSQNVGCYAKKIGDKIKRGCLSDLEDPNVCKGVEQFCQYCLGQDCNTSGTAKLLTSLGVLLLPLLVSLSFTF